MNEGMPKRIKVVLAISVLLNVFLLGAIGGGGYRWYAAERTAAVQPRGLRFAADGLDAGQRRQFLQGLRAARRAVAPEVDAAREGRHQVEQLLRQPQFEREALVAALARTREADAAVRSRIEQSVVDFAATLSPAERQQLADALVQRGPLRTAPAQPRTAAP
ncbi:periplasmic heavy metal sensor [Cupriavidus basilensis]|uniref:Periplasmic heavy metal sensor n=1 Tax=Cupriavidus basilensis TaxID=68895 RepID=A0ABT6ATD9_9BURK|nr:periplasmic heavy metal sensor [Cupriavidus basilensis]MDF3835734.1 periplasmic heavy metal sensor [Cupriavidus basilensis]